MKTALIIFAMVASVTAASATQLPADELLKWCTSKQDTWVSACMSYVMGVLAGVEMADKLSHTTANNLKTGQDPPSTFICVVGNPFPDVITDRVTDIIRWELNHFPDDKNLNASAVVFTALAKLYPCAGTDALLNQLPHR
jgi:hypothetical protein